MQWGESLAGGAAHTPLTIFNVLSQQEFVYLAVVMDVFTRSIRGWHLARSIGQSLTLAALKKGLEKGAPKIDHFGAFNIPPMNRSICCIGEVVKSA